MPTKDMSLDELTWRNAPRILNVEKHTSMNVPPVVEKSL